MQEDRDLYSSVDHAPLRSMHTRRSPSTSPQRSHRRSKHSRRSAASDSDASSDTRERRKRKKRKERERADGAVEAERFATLGGYAYAKRGQDREWDKDKQAPT